MKVSTLEGHSNPIYTVIAHPNKALFYTAGNDKGVVEWDLETKTHLRIFQQIKSTVYCLTIIEEQNLLIAGCNDGLILFFDLDSTKLLATISAGSAVFDLKYVSSKKELLASTDIGSIFIIDPINFNILHQFQSGTEKIRTIATSDKLNLITTASNDKIIRIYHLEDYTSFYEFEGHSQGVGAVAFSPEGTQLVTGSRDAHLRVWSTNNWECLYNFPAHLFAIYKIAYHPKYPYIATASRDKSVKIWRAEDFSLFKNLSIDKGAEGHRLSVNGLCWTNDGMHLISVSDDKLVKVWDFEF